MKEVNGVKTPFKDHCPAPSPKAPSGTTVNGEPGLPSRSRSSSGVDEVIRCPVKGS